MDRNFFPSMGLHTYTQNGTKRYMDVIASRCNDRFGSSRFFIPPFRPFGSLHSSSYPYIQLSRFCILPLKSSSWPFCIRGLHTSLSLRLPPDYLVHIPDRQRLFILSYFIYANGRAIHCRVVDRWIAVHRAFPFPCDTLHCTLLYFFTPIN